MRNNMTELVFILDKSGSMAGLEKDTIGGFNSLLEKQKAIEGECRITTVLFSTRSQILHDHLDIRAVRPITDKEYEVGGNTALLDAIGETVQKITAIQKNTAEEYRADKVMFVIITDGEENASSHFTSDMVKTMITRERTCQGWEFIFLGANIDAVETASRYGIVPDRAVDYVPDRKGTTLNFRTMSEAVREYRSSPDGVISDKPFEAIRRDKKERGTSD